MHLLQKYVFGSMIYIKNMFKSDFYMNIFGAWNHPSKFPIFLFWKFALTYEYLWFASSIKERIILVNQGITVTASILFYNCCQSRREACTEPKRWKVNKSFFNVHTFFFFFKLLYEQKTKGKPSFVFKEDNIINKSTKMCIFKKSKYVLLKAMRKLNFLLSYRPPDCERNIHPK